MNTHPINNTPKYLLTEKCIERGQYGIYAPGDNFEINYGPLNDVLSKLDGLVFGEYSLRVPKTSHEVCLGGVRLNNCMGAQGIRLMQVLQYDQNQYTMSKSHGNYIDIHVLKNNKLIGAIAAENIFKQKVVASCGYGLFINKNNAGNQEMDELLIPLINEVLNMKLEVVQIRNSQPIE